MAEGEKRVINCLVLGLQEEISFLFISLFERGEERLRERERVNPKQAPCSARGALLRAQSHDQEITT